MDYSDRVYWKLLNYGGCMPNKWHTTFILYDTNGLFDSFKHLGLAVDLLGKNNGKSEHLLIKGDGIKE